MEYISREAAIASLCCDCSATRDCRPGERCVDYQRIKAIPAADVREVVHGIWLTQEYMYGDPEVGIEDGWIERRAVYGDCAYCSICGENARLDGGEEYALTNYCPNCGAQMEVAHDNA